MANNRKLNERIKINLAVSILKIFFHIEKYFTKYKHINYPKMQCIFSIWHGEQMVVYGFDNKEKFYVLVSASNDGEIISNAMKSIGLKTVRGSSKRRAVAGSLEILEKLKNGDNIGMMVDGPKGPKGKVKEGIAYIAKMSGVPIVPVAWAAKNKTLIEFKSSWDNLKVPIGLCHTIALYGDPIYIPETATKEELTEWCLKIENEMNRINKDLKENYAVYENFNVEE